MYTYTYVYILPRDCGGTVGERRKGNAKIRFLQKNSRKWAGVAEWYVTHRGSFSRQKPLFCMHEFVSRL